MNKRIVLLSIATALGTSLSWADSISPASFSDTLNVGESVTITKTVTVSAGAPTTNQVDVFFLADETGSMSSEIAAVRAAVASIVSTTSGAGDVHFGVGGYRDVGDSFVYNERQDLTSNSALIQTAADNWTASGGGDTPEANLYALDQVASQTSWRTGSERILVWFGDQPGHDPGGPFPGVSEGGAIAALQGQSINVQAVDVGNLNGGNQAQRIADATGGDLYSGVNSSTIATVIQNAITSAIANYSSVGLDLSEAPAGVTVSATGNPIAGSFDRSVERSFNFDVTFTGDAVGSYDFNIYGTVDGGRVATERDSITVVSSSVPEGGTSAVMMGIALLSLGFFSRMKLRR